MKLTKFKGGTSKASEGIAAQSRKILQTFGWCELQRLASTKLRSVNLRDFAKQFLR